MDARRKVGRPKLLASAERSPKWSELLRWLDGGGLSQSGTGAGPAGRPGRGAEGRVYLFVLRQGPRRMAASPRRGRQTGQRRAGGEWGTNQTAVSATKDMGGDTAGHSGRAGARLPGGRITRIRRSSSLTAAAVTPGQLCGLDAIRSHPWWDSPGAMDANLEAFDSCVLAFRHHEPTCPFVRPCSDQAARLRWGDSVC